MLGFTVAAHEKTNFYLSLSTELLTQFSCERIRKNRKMEEPLEL